MKQFQIELDEVICQWLAHIAETTNQSIEEVISNVICQQVAQLEESIIKTFTYCE
ncbi:MAG: hypothetical protein FWE24_07240 [Defluviitaleaceae bacterium]|nr:hypothetical protein [Defluviitaleaceae bacterium]